MPKGICDSCDAPIDANDWWKSHNLCRLCEEDIASPEKNDKEQPMTTTNTTPILDLWNAMGEAGCIPDGIEYVDDWECFIVYDKNGDGSEPQDEHIAFILTGHAETWLRGRGWENIGDTEHACPTWSKKYGRKYHKTLVEALRAETGRG